MANEAVGREDEEEETGDMIVTSLLKCEVDPQEEQHCLFLPKAATQRENAHRHTKRRNDTQANMLTYTLTPMHTHARSHTTHTNTCKREKETDRQTNSRLTDR